VQSGNNAGAIGAVANGRWITGYIESGQACYFNGAVAGVALFDRALSAGEVAELYLGPEPTNLSSPTLPSELRVGSAAAVTTGSWEGHSNGSLVVTDAMQLSADGVSGWEDVAAIAGPGPYLVPLGAAGRWARVASSASNSGGVSEAAYSPAIEVLPARSPGAAVAQSYAKSGVVAGYACPAAGAQAGLVLSGSNP
jgi:hypothetical protein